MPIHRARRMPSGQGGERTEPHGRAVSYSSNMLRRTFLQTLPAAAAAMTAASAEEAPIKLGFDTYSVRAFKWKGTQLLDYAAGLKLDTIQFSALSDYGPVSYTHLRAH